MSDFSTFLGGAVRLSVPLAVAGCGEQVAERSGTLNISIEAMMLGGAFFGALGAAVTGTTVGGLAFGMAAGLVVAIVHANFSHRLTANTFVVGLTLNSLLVGLTSFLNETTDLDDHKAKVLEIPLLHRIPEIGGPVFGQRWPNYLILVVIPLSWWIVNRTRWGLELRAAGEDPQAADVTGIDVEKRRRQAIYYCGLMSGLAGALLPLLVTGNFNNNMTAGAGFLVNAAVIFGGWTLRGTMAGAALFGGAKAMYVTVQAIGWKFNPQLLIASPYLIALVTMLLLASRSKRPAALARQFERGIT
jgi:general nucleoside transport system permease protein